MKVALRLTGFSVLCGDAALVAGLIVSVVYGLGGEALPLTSPAGLTHLGRSVDAFTLRETLFLAYPVLLLPQAIALYALFRERAPALLWPLILWCVGLTLGIAVDVLTVGVVRGLGPAYLAAGADAKAPIEALAKSVSHTILLGQFVCDNLSGTLVYPFFAAAAYRSGFISRGLAITAAVSAVSVFLGYRGINLLVGEETSVGTVLVVGIYGLIWWDVNIAVRLLRVRDTISGTPDEESV